MSAFLHQIFYANNKFGSSPITFDGKPSPDNIYPYPFLDELSKWAIIKPIYVSPITFDGKPSPVIPRTPTLVPRSGVLTFVNDGNPSTKNPDDVLESHPDTTVEQSITGEDLSSKDNVRTPLSEAKAKQEQEGTTFSFAKGVRGIDCKEGVSGWRLKTPSGRTGEDLSSKVIAFASLKGVLANLSIFQSIFLLHYGYSEYIMAGNRMLNRELEEKQKIMETLSKTPKKLKEGNHKITNDNIQEILSGLLVATKEEIMHLVAYSAYYNRIIYLVFTHSYLVFSPTKDANVDSTNIQSVYILNQTRKHPKYGGSYYPDLEPTLEKLENIHNSKIHLEHYAKPFKGVSAYKIPELEEMAKKTGVFEKEVPVKYKKKELYDKIVEVCCAGISA